MAGLTTLRVPWAGLLAGPAALAINLPTSYALSAWTCSTGTGPIVALAALLLTMALAGAFLSWRAWHALPQKVPLDDSTSHEPDALIAASGVFLGCLFALVIALQGAAALVLDGCIR